MQIKVRRTIEGWQAFLPIEQVRACSAELAAQLEELADIHSEIDIFDIDRDPEVDEATDRLNARLRLLGLSGLTESREAEFLPLGDDGRPVGLACASAHRRIEPEALLGPIYDAIRKAIAEYVEAEQWHARHLSRCLTDQD